MKLYILETRSYRIVYIGSRIPRSLRGENIVKSRDTGLRTSLYGRGIQSLQVK